ncbi:unnamed protein product [Ilex paraguariensis]|uniref:QWRF motif-containing protein 3 n=1 Tax=Ilex paraguariensis TaxID=185542 RepID=A0ABC8S5J2_9AQUA
MKADHGEFIVSDQSSKLRRSKSRDVSSRFLSPTSTPSIESVIPSPNRTLSPFRQKPRAFTDSRAHRSLEASGFIGGLWPSSSAPSSSPSNKKTGTLADHLGNDRLKDLLDHDKSDNSMFLNRQRSCTELSRIENKKESPKENHKPSFGGSMTYTGKFRFPGRSSTSSSSKTSSLVDDHDPIVPGRLSVDENALRRKLFGRRSDLFSDIQDPEADSSDINICSGTSLGSLVAGKNSPASYMAPTVSSRKAGIEASSKCLNDLPSRSRRWTVDSPSQHPISWDNSPKKSTTKTSMRRANSLNTNGHVTSKWALSPGRPSSPPLPAESNGTPMNFPSSLKPPASPSRAKGVGNLISMGLDLFKSKKSSSSSSLPLGLGMTENVHQLRLLQNRLVQWRYANARGEAMNRSLTNQAESNLLHAGDGLAKLQHSVLQKKLELGKQKLKMKLEFILHSQVKQLEAWGDMERQHLSAVSMTKDCLHSVVCRVPFTEGATVEPQSVSISMRHASDLAASIKSILATSLPAAEKTVSRLTELAEVVAQEKSLLEECLELSRTILTLEMQERSLKCNVIQLRLWQQQQQYHHQTEITAYTSFVL